MSDRGQLERQILAFMMEIYGCYVNTDFADDRPVFAHDLTVAMGWIAKLEGGRDAKQVANQILAPATAKHFGDYWRQGEWGDKEADAFKKLKASIGN